MEYKMRNLQATDIFSVVKILNGIGIKHVKEAINIDEWRHRHMTLQELMDRYYEQGFEKGLEQVRAEGELKVIRRIARNFKNAGISAEVIAENTGLSLEEIEKL